MNAILDPSIVLALFATILRAFLLYSIWNNLESFCLHEYPAIIIEKPGLSNCFSFSCDKQMFTTSSIRLIISKKSFALSLIGPLISNARTICSTIGNEYTVAPAHAIAQSPRVIGKILGAE